MEGMGEIGQMGRMKLDILKIKLLVLSRNSFLHLEFKKSLNETE